MAKIPEKMKDVIREARKFARKFRVSDGKKFRLDDFDPGKPSGWARKTSREPRKSWPTGVAALAELQEMLYAQDRWAVLLIFQAMDAAGKDGAIKHVMSGVNPQGCQVYSFKAPVQRGARPRLLVALPASACRSAAASASSTAATTRRLLVVRVHSELLCKSEAARRAASTKDIWKERFQDIRAHRALSRARNGVADPASSSSTSRRRSRSGASSSASTTRRRTGSSPPATCRSGGYWNEYMEAYEDMIRQTATNEAPVVRHSGGQQVVHQSHGSRRRD